MAFITLHKQGSQEPMVFNTDHIMYLETRSADNSTNVALINRETVRVSESRDEIVALMNQAAESITGEITTVNIVGDITPEVQAAIAAEVRAALAEGQQPEDAQQPDHPAKKRETK